MNEKTKWRERARVALQHYFQKRSAPRTILTFLLALTGSFGFAISYISLHLGLKEMWLRYPLAVFGGYAFFLGLLRLWIEFERSRFNPDPEELKRVLGGKEISRGTSHWRGVRDGPSWRDYLDIPNFLDFDEGCLPVLLVGIVIGLIALLFFAVAAAPALLAEVFLDAFIVAVLYRRLRVAEREHWLGTAIRKTWWFVLLTAALLSLSGWGLETCAPGSHSIGPALQKFFHD